MYVFSQAFRKYAFAEILSFHKLCNYDFNRLLQALVQIHKYGLVVLCNISQALAIYHGFTRFCKVCKD